MMISLCVRDQCACVCMHSKISKFLNIQNVYHVYQKQTTHASPFLHFVLYFMFRFSLSLSQLRDSCGDSSRDRSEVHSAPTTPRSSWDKVCVCMRVYVYLYMYTHAHI